MSKKPLILMSASHDINPRHGGQQYVLNKNYALAVAAGGGIPLLASGERDYDSYAELADGLVLTGGWLLHPDNYAFGHCKAGDQETFNDEVRNPYDQKLYQAFKKAGKPVLGICQGLLAINIGQGGANSFDLPGEIGTEHGAGIGHRIKAEQGSIVESLFGPSLTVNSHHTHYIRKLGDDLRVTAFSDDGVPEAIEHVDLPVFGTQWHPERMRGEMPNPPDGPDMTRLFSYFVEQCSECRNKEKGAD
ncbi:gamma-glutamyl-gamma-aminobutyrate hydrolase family protein [Cohnella hongkongensis]|uniref:Gamma-glutamyl-gamma-aminobutyrate hydrolase family protein n=1 Tax=Cohnella hongkongensis TaxID=178337 RepID=A0ABV9F7M3_9BACL